MNLCKLGTLNSGCSRGFKFWDTLLETSSGSRLSRTWSWLLCGWKYNGFVIKHGATKKQTDHYQFPWQLATEIPCDLKQIFLFSSLNSIPLKCWGRWGSLSLFDRRLEDVRARGKEWLFTLRSDVFLYHIHCVGGNREAGLTHTATHYNQDNQSYL